MMTPQTRIDLFRHGEVLGGHYYRGITDDPLTALGWKQMQQRMINFDDYEVIISSPLQRCLDFGQALSHQRSIPLAINTGFQEINFGDWEGKTAVEIEQQTLGSLMRFYQNPIQHPPPNSEPILDFQQRIQKAWQQLLRSHQQKNILMITHGGVIRSLFSLLLKIPINHSFSVTIHHAALTRFRCFHGDPDFIQLDFHLNDPSKI